ncbi:MAG: muconolactone Delta-isomerase family protein [bacterium]
MKILAIEKEMPGVIAEMFQSHLKHEAAKVWELHKAGIIREIYFGKEEHNAVIILECKDMEEAKEILSGLPLVQHGLINFEITVLEPYDGFERLFKKPTT